MARRKTPKRKAPKRADIGGKRLIGLNADAWLRWLTGLQDAQALDVITSDLQWIARESDVFIRAYHPPAGSSSALPSCNSGIAATNRCESTPTRRWAGRSSGCRSIPRW